MNLQTDTLSTNAISSNFHFTILGHIESSEGVNYLVCRENIKFPVNSLPALYPPGVLLWQAIPSTDSTGEISNLTLLNFEQVNLNNYQEDKCLLIGRVVQLGKKYNFTLVKVNRNGGKTLKITLLSPDRQMKIGHLWQIIAVRQGRFLHVNAGNLLKENPSDSDENLANLEEQNQKINSSNDLEKKISIGDLVPGNADLNEANGNNLTTKAPNSLTTPPPIEDAIAALVAETQLENWNIGKPKQRANKTWEWNAIHPSTQQRARVRIIGKKNPHVYQYPSIAQTDAQENTNLAENTHLAVTPLGAARGIGASCFRVEIGPYEVVLDCGSRPKGYDPLPALEYLNNPDLLIVSHAHLDHLGAVPVFHNRYPGVRIICTHGTREIAHIMLRDCLKVQNMNEDSTPLFDDVDLERTLFRLETQPVGVDFEPLPGLKVRFINAGHILGAACIYMTCGERSLIYTGDYNTTSSRTTTGLRLADLPSADILITESTYGADNHPSRKAQETALIDAIAEVIKAGGNVLIPAFALGRAQEILLAIRTSMTFHTLKIPVYVDGLVRSVTETFRDNLELLPESVQNFVKQCNREPFFDANEMPPIIPISNPKERPLAMAKPSVIVASSGMLSGGASVYYAQTLLERENAAIFISGYTDEESPGRLLQNLAVGDEIELDGKKITVKAQIKRFNLSAHADKIGLTQVINKVNPKHLILIHGCGNALHSLADSGDLKSKHYIHIPSVGERIEYGQAPEHLSQSQLAKIELPQEFEVSIEAEIEGAWLQIPLEVVENDPRWQLLANSGILKASWEGYHLKLSPITQKNISSQKAIEDAITKGEDCCAVCKFYQGGKCKGEESALFEFQVDPGGICAEFSSDN
ncbi:exonuclease [Oscillatoriales cyanobacterium USR001]|nr:exonuclease [Oscillatoriales cyanobacterium USR001]